MNAVFDQELSQIFPEGKSQLHPLDLLKLILVFIFFKKKKHRKHCFMWSPNDFINI